MGSKKLEELNIEELKKVIISNGRKLSEGLEMIIKLYQEEDKENKRGDSSSFWTVNFLIKDLLLNIERGTFIFYQTGLIDSLRENIKFEDNFKKRANRATRLLPFDPGSSNDDPSNPRYLVNDPRGVLDCYGRFKIFLIQLERYKNLVQLY